MTHPASPIGRHLQTSDGRSRARASRRRRRLPVLSAAILALVAAAPRVAGADSGATDPSQPNWLKAPSASVGEGYDGNLYGVSNSPAGHPNVANVSCAFTTLGLAFTIDPLAGRGAAGRGFLTAATLAYEGIYTAYDAAAREDNLRSTLTLALQGKGGPWSLSISNPFVIVGGSRQDPFYSTYTPIGYGPTRERRNQVQERDTSFLRYDTVRWFVRVVANAAAYDLMIDEHDPVGPFKGYVNWVDRADLNTGVDVGAKLDPDFALVAGWRIGRQTQARPWFATADSGSTYNRVLLGIEGRPVSWLDVDLTAGPDFRRYDDAGAGIAGSRHTWLYTEGKLTATVSGRDRLTASERVWHWVSSSGTSSYQDTQESLSYRHVFSPALSVSAGFALTGARYDAPNPRNDWGRSYPVDLTYTLARGLVLEASYVNGDAFTRQPAALAAGQNFTRNLVALSARVSL